MSSTTESLMKAPANPPHAIIDSRADGALGDPVEGHDLGEVLASETRFLPEGEPRAIARSPELAFVSEQRPPRAEVSA